VFQEFNKDQVAGIEYHGTAGITSHCLDAIARLIQFGQTIEKAELLTFDSQHAFLLTIEYGVLVAIKSGFGSGYSGEGSRGLAKALLLLQRHCDEIEEYAVTEELFERLEQSCLLSSDLEWLERSHPVRPAHYYDYIFDQYWDDEELTLNDLISRRDSDSSEHIPRNSVENRVLNRLFPAAIPFGILDNRIVDLALKFKHDPDAAIMTAYKRLEGIIRRRIGGSDKVGTKLISQAFLSGNNSLHWKGEHETEQRGRLQLFSGAMMAFRNRRAHNEVKLEVEEELREFLLVNELFLLEGTAELNTAEDPN
tara:strand:- start:86 stop:1012 length:927 start_codon:yes stop_codon:yes gene_type:complete